jgi:outer membrane protein OmpA-like peptidoglycan-associated protein
VNQSFLAGITSIPGIVVSLPSTAKHLATFFLLLLAFHFSDAQNLFANPGFEDINTCTEYEAPCAPEAWFYIHPTTNPLVNGLVAAKPLLGHNLLLVPVGNVYDTVGSRYQVYTMLGCRLTAGLMYKLSFFLNTSKREFYNLGFCFTDIEPASRDFNRNAVKSIVTVRPADLVADLKYGWKAVELTFRAETNAAFCILGNFDPEPFPFSMDDKMSKSGNVYYFIDEIKLQPLPPAAPCDAYEKNIKRMYDQNNRHTEYMLVGEDESKIKPPVYITDTITIPAAFFAKGNARLKPAYKKTMDSLLQKISSLHLTRIDIIGHTDNAGDPVKNQQLSVERALAVKDYFNQAVPQYNDKIFANGKGPDQPVASNLSSEGRSKNRRVEIVITILE